MKNISFCTNIKSPCISCGDRKAGCHGKCLLYENYKKEIDNLHISKEKENLIKAYISENKERQEEYKRNHKYIKLKYSS